MLNKLKDQCINARPEIFSDPGYKISDTNDHVTPLEDTLKKIESAKFQAGITRVADITQLDTTGIYAFQSIRPDAEMAENTFTVFSGKGHNPMAAKIAAIAEGIERFCAEKKQHPKSKIITASFNELINNKQQVISPNAFNQPSNTSFLPQVPIEWTLAQDILSKMSYWVPACSVYFPYEPDTGIAPLPYFTTGLAAGNTYLEAISHGLAEVIERDAAFLNNILRDRPVIDLDSITNPEIKNKINQCIDAGLNIIIRYITTEDIAVPAFSVICDDEKYQDPLYVSGGYGAHVNKDIALMTALNEAALSRVGTISGAREDLAKFAKKRTLSYVDFRKKYAYWFETEKNIVPYDAIPLIKHRMVLDDLVYMLNEIKHAHLPHTLYVDLTVEGLPLSVVKVLVPGIERYSYSMQSIGVRAKNLFEAKYKKPLVKS